MFDPPAAACAPADQLLGGEPVGESSERLIALKRLDRQCMGGSAGVPVDGPQRIPLGERGVDGGETGVERSVVTVLDLLDSASQGLQVCRHDRSIQLSKVAYINMLR